MAPQVDGGLGVRDLVHFHLFDNGATLLVLMRQSLKMAIEVLLNLPLCLGHEPKAERVSCAPRNHSNGKCAKVPKQIQAAGVPPKRLETLRCPRKVISLLQRRLTKPRSKLAVACSQRLRLIQRLRTHLADMIDTHQFNGLSPLLCVEICARQTLTRRRATAARYPNDALQRNIELMDNLIDEHLHSPLMCCSSVTTDGEVLGCAPHS